MYIGMKDARIVRKERLKSSIVVLNLKRQQCSDRAVKSSGIVIYNFHRDDINITNRFKVLTLTQ